MRDPNVLTVPMAAKVAGVGVDKFREWLKDGEFFDAVVLQQPKGFQILISRPRLLRQLHGDEWHLIIDGAGA